jgi:phage tail-like protein
MNYPDAKSCLARSDPFRPSRRSFRGIYLDAIFCGHAPVAGNGQHVVSSPRCGFRPVTDFSLRTAPNPPDLLGSRGRFALTIMKTISFQFHQASARTLALVKIVSLAVALCTVGWPHPSFAQAVEQRVTAQVFPVLAAAKVTLSIDGGESISFNQVVSFLSQSDEVFLGPSEIFKTDTVKHQSAVVLRRSADGNQVLWNWRNLAATNPSAAIKTCIITLSTSTGKVIARFSVERAWPARLELADVSPKNTVLSETLTITCDHLQRIAP